MRYSDPYPHFAGLFAAKEAIIKSLPAQADLFPNKIEIYHDASGSPHVRIDADIEQSIILSISHSRHNAVAIALSMSRDATIDPESFRDVLEAVAMKAQPAEVQQDD